MCSLFGVSISRRRCCIRVCTVRAQQRHRRPEQLRAAHGCLCCGLCRVSKDCRRRENVTVASSSFIASSCMRSRRDAIDRSSLELQKAVERVGPSPKKNSFLVDDWSSPPRRHSSHHNPSFVLIQPFQKGTTQTTLFDGNHRVRRSQNLGGGGGRRPRGRRTIGGSSTPSSTAGPSAASSRLGLGTSKTTTTTSLSLTAVPSSKSQLLEAARVQREQRRLLNRKNAAAVHWQRLYWGWRCRRGLVAVGDGSLMKRYEQLMASLPKSMLCCMG